MKITYIELSKHKLIETDEGLEIVKEKSVKYPLILTNSAIAKSKAEGILTQDLKTTLIALNKAKTDIEKEGMEFDPTDVFGFFTDSFILAMLYTGYRGASVMSSKEVMAYSEFMDLVNVNDKEVIKAFNDLATNFMSSKN